LINLIILAIGQKKMTTKNMENNEDCPAEGLLKMLSGKWKPQIFRLALEGPIRFNSLLRQMEGSNKQSVAVALRELEEQGLLDKVVVKLKPLHIEYNLSEKGKLLILVFRQLETLV
jgi:DNA-binding HxlR family transcriptional regulator